MPKKNIPNLKEYDKLSGSFGLLLNPAPSNESGSLNPFSLREVRYAMNYLRIATAPFPFALLLFAVTTIFADHKSISLTRIGTYASGIFDAGVQKLSLMTLGRSVCSS